MSQGYRKNRRGHEVEGVRCSLGLLHFDLGAMRKAQGALGKPFRAIVEALADEDVEAVATLAWAGLLRHQPEMTRERVEEELTVRTFREVFLALDEALAPYVYGPERAREILKLRDKALQEAGRTVAGLNPPPSESQEMTPS